MTHPATVPARADASDWIPMRAYRGRRSFEIRDPLIEPLWSGVRVLATVERPTGAPAAGDPAAVGDPVATVVHLVEVAGADVAGELPDLAAALGAAVLVEDAVLDGVITPQVGLDDVGASAVPEVRARASDLLMRNRAELDVVRRGSPDVEEPAAEGFVAVDLLRLDGQSLLDIPLLERKRLLESVIAPSALVRVSVHVRPPVSTWVATWKSLGLRGAVLKAANSRYRPGTDSIEWRVVESMDRRGSARVG